MRKFCFIFVLISLSFAIGEVSFAKLDPKFRKVFPEFVQNLCASTIDYELGDPTKLKSVRERTAEFESHRLKYHGTIECLLNQAIKGRIVSTNEEIVEFFGRDVEHPDFDFKNFEKPDQSCEDGMFERVIDEQKDIRRLNVNLATHKIEPITTCIGTDLKIEEDIYSSCRVAEMLLTELCGYQNYLEAKLADDPTLLVETDDERRMDTIFNGKAIEMEKFIEMEKIQSRKALHNTILFYQQFEQNYRRHAWLVAISEGLDKVSTRWAYFRDKIFRTFPDKFIDHSL